MCDSGMDHRGARGWTSDEMFDELSDEVSDELSDELFSALDIDAAVPSTCQLPEPESTVEENAQALRKIRGH